MTSTAADVQRGLDAAKDEDVTTVATMARQVGSVATTRWTAMNRLPPFVSGRGVLVNLQAAAGHLGAAASALAKWSDAEASKWLSLAAAQLKAARLNLGRATIDRGSLERTTGLSCD